MAKFDVARSEQVKTILEGKDAKSDVVALTRNLQVLVKTLI